MKIDVITGFPKMVKEPLNQSMLKISQQKKIVEVKLYDLRDYTTDKHRTIDDYPYGGGPGMVLRLEPVVKVLDNIFESKEQGKAKIIMPTPRGELLKQSLITELSLQEHLIFLCGHYKGIDERVHHFYEITELSLGDYVLSSGELAALVIIDSLVRLLPGVLKDIDSAWTDSFSDYLLDVPYYTRPEIFRDIRVPEVLLSGNHKNIEDWRKQLKEEITRQRRPDLYEKHLKQ